jgi:hypothetical protein
MHVFSNFAFFIFVIWADVAGFLYSLAVHEGHELTNVHYRVKNKEKDQKVSQNSLCLIILFGRHGCEASQMKKNCFLCLLCKNTPRLKFRLIPRFLLPKQLSVLKTDFRTDGFTKTFKGQK